ncbi:MAG TPA: choice-of-anchor tandem repeat GloVer-containing protein [Rhizomicrobium sp.]|jgi:uncharacterized repeat protein (TIGR03803 family)|nr:choice-of-anchor tandem repeat GloVer-containing protein [Rhizomicrobium sp.]
MASNLKSFRVSWRAHLLGAAIVATAIAPSMGGERVLHTFQGGSDGVAPRGSLIMDKTGSLFGITAGGGGETGCGDSAGCGTVFQIAPDRAETVLHAFAGGCDGADPITGLAMDNTGNMYGTTIDGGICNSAGFGTIYKLAPGGAESVLYAFQNDQYGDEPSSGVIIDSKGNLYGEAGGGNPAGCVSGCGLVFELAPEGGMNVLYAFQGGSDGFGPSGGLIMDGMGDLYGTTERGGGTGCDGFGCGTVFKIAPDGTETVIYAFQGGTDGSLPQNGVVADGAGNLYGTTAADGAVFKVMPDGTETLLHSFQGGKDGDDPASGVVLDKAGSLYGTTYYGGAAGCQAKGCGVVYEISPKGKETVLYGFRGSHGKNPWAGLLVGAHDNLYGTTLLGGKGGHGVVFELKPK